MKYQAHFGRLLLNIIFKNTKNKNNNSTDPFVRAVCLEYYEYIIIIIYGWVPTQIEFRISAKKKKKEKRYIYLLIL